jgi:hypothetical protein
VCASGCGYRAGREHADEPEREREGAARPRADRDAQVLFAFLLTLPFTQRFGDLSDLQRDVYFATLCGTIASTAFLMTAPAYHRLRWRRYDKALMLRISNRTAIAGLVCLALAMCGAAFLIADVMFGGRGAAATVAGAAALIGVLWFALPLRREMRDDGATSRPGP